MGSVGGRGRDTRGAVLLLHRVASIIFSLPVTYRALASMLTPRGRRNITPRDKRYSAYRTLGGKKFSIEWIDVIAAKVIYIYERRIIFSFVGKRCSIEEFIRTK